MKVGLLMCDHVYPEYQTQFGDYSDMFERLFPEFQFVTFDVRNGDFPNDLNSCELYMATGSRHSVYDDMPWIDELKKFIQNLYAHGKCFVGFCFGHQLIGESLGGKVEKSPNGWCVGVHEFNVSKSKSWMKPDLDQFNLLMMCQDQIINLPAQTEVLAGSMMCPYGLIQVGKSFLGIQAHPEFSKEYDKMLMETRMNRMGDEVALRGIESLSGDVHTSVLKDWIIQFINSQ